MQKTNGWQTTLKVIATIGFLGGIIIGEEIKTLDGSFNWPLMLSSWFSFFILCLFIYGLGTLIEQNDIIISLLDEKKTNK